MKTRSRLGRRIAAVALIGVLAASFAACSSMQKGESSGAESEGSTTPEQPAETLTVYAAASLKEAFDELATAFEAEHENFDVQPIVYDGSQILATQIIEGAPADVFASADERNMQKVVDEGLAKDPARFATNTLVVAYPASNPADVKTLADLARVRTVLCLPDVPCGNASQKLLSNAGITVTPVSQEQNVRAVLAKLSEQEADAGLVYATDVIGDSTVGSFVPEGASEVVNVYPVAAIEGSANPNAAKAFVEFVLGEQGQAILAKYGFGKG